MGTNSFRNDTATDRATHKDDRGDNIPRRVCEDVECALVRVLSQVHNLDCVLREWYMIFIKVYLYTIPV